MALVVADSEQYAKKAAALVIVQYIPLPVVNSPGDAIKSNALLIHENLGKYKLLEEVYPEPGTNVANRTRIRKGDIKKGWLKSEVIAEASVSFPQSDHAAMETRSVIAEIKPDGQVIIHSSSQAPFTIKKLIGICFNIEPGKITVKDLITSPVHIGLVVKLSLEKQYYHFYYRTARWFWLEIGE